MGSGGSLTFPMAPPANPEFFPLLSFGGILLQFQWKKSKCILLPAFDIPAYYREKTQRVNI